MYRIALSVVALSFSFCCCWSSFSYPLAGSAGEGFKNEGENLPVPNPAEAEQVGQMMLTYDLPTGYQAVGVSPFFGAQALFFRQSAATTPPFFMWALTQYPTALMNDPAEMRRQMQESWHQQSGEAAPQYTWETVTPRAYTIRGEVVTMMMEDGVDQDGTAFRRLSGSFADPAGPVQLMAQGPLDAWDQTALDNFIASIR